MDSRQGGPGAPTLIPLKTTGWFIYAPASATLWFLLIRSVLVKMPTFTVELTE